MHKKLFPLIVFAWIAPLFLSSTMISTTAWGICAACEPTAETCMEENGPEDPGACIQPIANCEKANNCPPYSDQDPVIQQSSTEPIFDKTSGSL